MRYGVLTRTSPGGSRADNTECGPVPVSGPAHLGFLGVPTQGPPIRPEKNHAAQLRALRSLFLAHSEYREGPERVTLVLLGSVRSSEDEARVDSLKRLAIELEIQVCRRTPGHPTKRAG